MDTSDLIKTVKALLIVSAVIITGGIVTITLIINNKSTTKELVDVDYKYSYYLIGKNGKYGVKSIDGKKIVPIMYDTVYVEEDDNEWKVFRCQKDNNEAIYSITGDCIVSLNEYYNRCYPGNFGIMGKHFIEVWKDYEFGDKYGLISSNGSTILQCKYSNIHYNEHAHYFEAEDDNGIGLFDMHGSNIIKSVKGYNNFMSFECNGENYLLCCNLGDNKMGLFCKNNFLFEYTFNFIGIPYIVKMDNLYNGEDYTGKGFYVAFKYSGWIYAYDKYGTYIGSAPISGCRKYNSYDYELLYDPVAHGFYYTDIDNENNAIFLNKAFDSNLKVIDIGPIHAC